MKITFNDGPRFRIAIKILNDIQYMIFNVCHENCDI